MDPSNTPLALVPSSSGPVFAQQGSVDWVALSNTTWSASIAVLARLSRAGLEPLTVAVAQGVFSQVPIGVHGERFLEKAMSELKANNILGTTLWFGFGVRHILRELPRSSQGASSVALVAALSEGFPAEFTATVLYDLLRVMNVPMDLTPSYAQWLAYTRICAGLLSSSGIGGRISQLAKILGIEVLQERTKQKKNFTLTTLASDLFPWRKSTKTTSDPAWFSESIAASAPEQVAKFLLGIGSIQRREAEAINVVGGIACLWGYVICDMIFGLRVQLCGPLKLSTGATIPATTTVGTVAQNYDSNSNNYQIRFVVEISKSTTAEMVQTDRTYSLHPGRIPSHLRTSGSSELLMHASWRVPFDKLLDCLLGYELPDDSKAKERLARMLGCHVLVRHYSPTSRNYCQHPSPVDLLYRFAGIMPDFRPFCAGAEAFIRRQLDQLQTVHTTLRAVMTEFHKRNNPQVLLLYWSLLPGVDQKKQHAMLLDMYKSDYLDARKRILSTLGSSRISNAWYCLAELASICCSLVVEENLYPTLAGVRRVLQGVESTALETYIRLSRQ